MSLLRLADEFLETMRSSRSSVVLTGAGVSTASGIPDFRSPRGLYSVLSQEIFELDLFLANPLNYYSVAVENIHTIADKTPNETHELLARLEKVGLVSAVITQNIDRLHQKAGSKRVVELHGNVETFHCMKCEKPFGRKEVELLIAASGVPRCGCGGLIKPDIVFFGEELPLGAIVEAGDLVKEADTVFAMGTSLVVYPAAGLPVIGKENGSKLVIVNRGETGLDYLADEKYEVSLEDFSRSVLSLLDEE